MLEHPFPHLVIDGAFDPALLDMAHGEAPRADSPTWRGGSNPTKGGRRNVWLPALECGPAASELIRQITHLGRALFTPELEPDLRYAGLFQMNPDQHLASHVDHNAQGRRSHNALLFLAREAGEGGSSILGDGSPSVVIRPKFNRLLIFEMSPHSWHGVSEVVGWRRMLIAVNFKDGVVREEVPTMRWLLS